MWMLGSQVNWTTTCSACSPCWGGNTDGIGLMRVCRTLNTIAGRQKSVESRNQRWVTLEEGGDAVNHPWGVDASGKKPICEKHPNLPSVIKLTLRPSAEGKCNTYA